MNTYYSFPFLGLVFSVLFTACGGGGGQESTVPARQATPLDLSTVGTITGAVRFEGTAPDQSVAQLSGWSECSAQHPQGNPPAGDVLVKEGKLQNAMIYIKDGLGNRVFAVPTETVEMDQKGCVFIPRVLGAQVGQPLKFLNSDPMAHNVHGFAQKAKPWNISLSVKGTSRSVKVDKPESMIEIKCDIHPWMRAYVGVFDHPYFALSGADGSFTLNNVPPGEYTVEAWHERFGTRSQKVTVSAKETKAIEFAFTAG
jgi:plastocyanin